MSKDSSRVLVPEELSGAVLPGEPASAVADDTVGKLGDRVRSLRSELGWTLEYLAERSGVSRSSLSKLERNQVSPTYDVIQRLAKGFGMSIVEFFDGAPKSAAMARRAVTFVGEGKYVEGRGYIYKSLCDDLYHKRMIPFRARILAKTLEEAGGYVRHTGEECIFVLSGEIELHTEFYKPLRLKAGDTVYIDSSMGHACTKVGNEPAEIFWITVEG